MAEASPTIRPLRRRSSDVSSRASASRSHRSPSDAGSSRRAVRGAAEVGHQVNAFTVFCPLYGCGKPSSAVPLRLEPPLSYPQIAATIAVTTGGGAVFAVATVRGLSVYRQPQYRNTNSSSRQDDSSSLSEPWLLQEMRSEPNYQGIYLLESLHPSERFQHSKAKLPSSHQRYLVFASTQRVEGSRRSTTAPSCGSGDDAHFVSVSSSSSHFLTSHALHGCNRILAVTVASLCISTSNGFERFPLAMSLDEQGGLCCLDLKHDAATAVQFTARPRSSPPQRSAEGSSSSTSDQEDKDLDKDSPLLPFIGSGGRLGQISLRLAQPCLELCNSCPEDTASPHRASSTHQDSHSAFATTLYLSFGTSNGSSSKSDESVSSQQTILAVRLRCAFQGLKPHVTASGVTIVDMCSSSQWSKVPATSAIEMTPRSLCLDQVHETSSLQVCLQSTSGLGFRSFYSCSARPLQTQSHGALRISSQAALTALSQDFFTHLLYVGPQEVETDVDGEGSPSRTDTGTTTTQYWSHCFIGWTLSGYLLLLGVNDPATVQPFCTSAANTSCNMVCKMPSSSTVPSPSALMSEEEQLDLEKWLDNIEDEPHDRETEVLHNCSVANEGSGKVFLPEHVRPSNKATEATLCSTVSRHAQPMLLQTLSILYGSSFQGSSSSSSIKRPTKLFCSEAHVFVTFDEEEMTLAIPLPFSRSFTNRSSDKEHKKETTTTSSDSPKLFEWKQIQSHRSPSGSSVMHLLTSTVHNMSIPVPAEDASLTRVFASLLFGSSGSTMEQPKVTPKAATPLSGGVHQPSTTAPPVVGTTNHVLPSSQTSLVNPSSFASSSMADSANDVHSSASSKRKVKSRKAIVIRDPLQTTMPPNTRDDSPLAKLEVIDIAPVHDTLPSTSLLQVTRQNVEGTLSADDRDWLKQLEAVITELSQLCDEDEPSQRNAILYAEGDAFLTGITVPHEEVMQRAPRIKQPSKRQGMSSDDFNGATAATALVTSGHANAGTKDVNAHVIPLFHFVNAMDEIKGITTSSARFLSHWRYRCTVASSNDAVDKPVRSLGSNSGPRRDLSNASHASHRDFRRSVHQLLEAIEDSTECLPDWLLSQQETDRCVFELRDLQLRQQDELDAIDEFVEVNIYENQRRVVVGVSSSSAGDVQEDLWAPFAKCNFQYENGDAVDVDALNRCGQGLAGWLWEEHHGPSTNDDTVERGTTAALRQWRPSTWRYAMLWPPQEPGTDEHWSVDETMGCVRSRMWTRRRVDPHKRAAREALTKQHVQEREALAAELCLEL